MFTMQGCSTGQWRTGLLLPRLPLVGQAGQEGKEALEGKKVAQKVTKDEWIQIYRQFGSFICCVEYEAAKKGQMGSKIIFYSQPFGRIATFCDRISAPGPWHALAPRIAFRGPIPVVFLAGTLWVNLNLFIFSRIILL